MKRTLALFAFAILSGRSHGARTSTGWQKYSGNPVLGGSLGTIFDLCLLQEGHSFRMWASWRPKKSIALFESKDGLHWSGPQIALSPDSETGWEDDVNRPVVIQKAGLYHMWYTGQAHGHSSIGYATSKDGLHWKRVAARPVLAPGEVWEKVAVMCPDVLWDAGHNTYKMWYSGGDQYEPDAIGYATSTDGINWRKAVPNPIFKADPKSLWERYKVTACQIVRSQGWYYMFYIGFRDVDHAQIGLARSRGGVTEWQRLPANPIVGPTADQWDADACYKPFAILDGDNWLLWYNGRHAHVEQIGLAIHHGKTLW